MKLGKLLAAGQSIMNGRTDISYRSNKQIYLPKFGCDRNPFKTEAPAPAAGSDSPAASERDAAAKSMAVTVQNTPSPSSHEKKKKRWTNKLNPLSIFGSLGENPNGIPGSAGTAYGKRTRGADTQTELSLNTVRVVHNDLSDVDVEIVPIKSRSVSPEVKPAKSSWEMLGERLFGVEPT